ncbi:MAG: hypothetical protein H0S80_00395 [Desulfovibrionaceae bacterium]|nr:hypothetical protein [Desulfovibrionaceae bacterium]
MANLTRRQLFRGNLTAGRQDADRAAGDVQHEPAGAPRHPAELGAIAGDFPPEMLSLEAQRLGMDPDSTDRENLLAAIYDAMAGNGPRSPGR